MRTLFSGLRGLVVLLVLAAALSACSGSSGPLAIDSVTLMRDNGSGQAGDTVTEFKTSDKKIYAKAALNQMANNVPAKVTWNSVDSSFGQNVALPGGTADLGSVNAVNVITTDISPANGLPAGKYRVDFYLNGQVAKTAEFTVTQ